MTPNSFVLKHPEQRTTSVVFASPHSGRSYSEWLKGNVVLNEVLIRTSEDAYVDRLFESVTDFGSSFLTAEVPRAFVDLNRGPDEFDSALIEGVRRKVHNPRIVSGLGVIPRVVAGGRAIYRGKITLDEAHRRLQAYWHPYHDQLQALLDRNIADFGEAILIDCHSMPREALDANGGTSPRPEIVIGDRFGASAASRIVDRIGAAFEDEGFSTVRNTPFAGAYSTIAYGRPTRAQHAVQIEIDRSLYMNERTLEPRPDFEDLRSRLNRVIAKITAIGEHKESLAAE